MLTEELLRPRYKVIADYPNSDYEIGQIIINESDYCTRYPAIFKPLAWWQGRTLDEIVSVKFVKIIEYTGYWRVGDIVPVTDYSIIGGRFIKYQLKYNHEAKPETVEPSTEAEYITFKNTK